jgi:hypothetical protein
LAEYLLMVLEDEEAHASQSPRAMADLIAQRAAYVAELRREGRLEDSARLRPSKEGKRVRRLGGAAGAARVDDGPFAEEGKALGGYVWVEASSADEAAEIAARCPTLATDAIDVRPLMKGAIQVDKEARPGKIFAFAVLGNTATEAGWVQVMDRIDADSRGRFPETASLGGVRLEPPSRGRRVVTRGERRATFDGPFLESKEVIGGVFFLRMTSLEEAVRWAAQTPFIVHGSLEIRELWRT